ncbi:hypothetical protein VTL71DRAFT_7985 [Oculimacula yallundae]|uniref:Uncharacterized protein n=1 Tax=Oculimacula yallundae TaxID=86028 RepID=A0ABR4CX95_9HELO
MKLEDLATLHTEFGMAIKLKRTLKEVKFFEAREKMSEIKRIKLAEEIE